MNKIAIIYDFDKTLCTANMQEYSLLPKLNVDTDAFWNEVNQVKKDNNMDATLAYMFLLVKYAKEKGIRKEDLKALGQDVQLYPGVKEYFQRINNYGKEKGVEVQHFVISSGNSEIIEGTDIFKEFTRVYASSYHYDEQGKADWPSIAINYTSKTQFLFRISKGSLDIYDDSKINAKIAEKNYEFSNMVYVADGYNDIPCMKLVKDYGGTSIAVHDEESTIYKQLLEDGRVNYVAKADYRENGEFDKIIHHLIDKVALQEQLSQYAKV